MKTILFIVLAAVTQFAYAQKMFIRSFQLPATQTEDVIERESEIEVLWFVDENSLVRETDTSYWARTDANNLINNAGDAISGPGTISSISSSAIVMGLLPVARANFRGKLEA